MNVIWDMTIGEIGQIAGLSTAVVVSLILGVKALRRTKELQEEQFKREDEMRKREHRQKLLDEIIEWAIDISKCGLEVELQSQFAPTTEGYLALRDRMVQFQNAFKVLLRKSKYIKSIVLPSWRVLNSTIKELQKQLDSHITEFDEYIEDITNKSRLEALDKHRTTINKLVVGVIDEATKIKIRDIV